MNRACRRLRTLLADGGPARLKDHPGAVRHGIECRACFELYDAFERLDRALDRLPPIDAPDAVVDALLLRLPAIDANPAGADGNGDRPRTRLRWIPALGGGLAAALLLVVAGGLHLSGDLDDSLRRALRSAPTAEPSAASRNDAVLPGEPDETAAEPPAPRATTGAAAAEPTRPGGFDEPWLSRAVESDDDGFTPQESTPPADPPASTTSGPPAASTERKTIAAVTETKPVAPPTGAPKSPPPTRAGVSGSSPDPHPARASGAAPATGSGTSGGTGGLYVRVVDSSGAPLPGATVTLSHPNGKVKSYAVLSDRWGTATFPVLRPGAGYVIEAAKPSFGTRREGDVRVPVGDVAPLVVQLAEETIERVSVVASQSVADLDKATATSRFSDEYIQDLPVPGRFYQNVLTLAPGISDPDGDGEASVHGSRGRDFKAVVGGVANVDPLMGEFMSLVESDDIEELEVVTGGAGVEFGRAQGGFARIIERKAKRSGATPSLRAAPPRDEKASAAARAFLVERRQVDDVPTRPSAGRWLNRYVPGDPAMRLLQARLAAPMAGSALPALHERARRVRQPFDPPRDGAVAVSLRCDRRGVEGRARALVQVGLQASTRHAGRRPALNLGIVLDLGGEVPVQTGAALRALLVALNDARDVGDRFSLTIAGLAGRVAVDPDDFRLGPLSVTLADALERAGQAAPGAGFPVTAALREAIERVGRVGDPPGPIGSSAVLLVTARPQAGSIDALVSLAHHGALAGIPVGVVAVGEDVERSELESLALAGHGSLRFLLVPADAPALVEHELATSSRAVARALRLNVRLAPGVELVDVVGSRPLGDEEAARARRAELSIDRRLAQDLGIVADRDDDGEGIQIFIPAFYSGDSHVVLLDVIVPGAGPVAEAEVRFKDLVQSRNAVTRAGLALAGSEGPAGPLEVNVVRNLLAVRLAETLDDAGRRVRGGDRAGAHRVLRDYRALLRGLAVEEPALGGDAGLLADGEMLTGYVAAVRGLSPGHDDRQAALGDSLLYAGLLKLLPRPVF